MTMVPIILGLVSSLHCIGMCGPIAIMIPNAIGGQSTILQKIRNILLYNGGRTLTYMVYGLFFGMIGKSFAWFGWQQQISIALGVLILLGLTITLFTRNNTDINILSPVFTRIRKGFSVLIGKGNASSLFGIGLLNGLLPCGMVYLALAGAVASGTPGEGAVFMGLFGLGTIPAMAALAYFGSLLKPSVRQYARKLFPAMMFLMAILLIVRGMNLGIPFLSPELENTTAANPVSCH